MRTAFLRTVLRLALSAVMMMMMMVVLAAGGTPPHQVDDA